MVSDFREYNNYIIDNKVEMIVVVMMVVFIMSVNVVSVPLASFSIFRSKTERTGQRTDLRNEPLQIKNKYA
jgi:hypothetical protein